MRRRFPRAMLGASVGSQRAVDRCGRSWLCQMRRAGAGCRVRGDHLTSGDTTRGPPRGRALLLAAPCYRWARGRRRGFIVRYLAPPLAAGSSSFRGKVGAEGSCGRADGAGHSRSCHGRRFLLPAVPGVAATTAVLGRATKAGRRATVCRRPVARLSVYGVLVPPLDRKAVGVLHLLGEKRGWGGKIDGGEDPRPSRSGAGAPAAPRQSRSTCDPNTMRPPCSAARRRRGNSRGHIRPGATAARGVSSRRGI